MRRRRPGPSRRARRLTWATLAGVAVCLGAGSFELTRALGGNPLSWVYTFEWPLIAAYVVHIRHRLVVEDRRQGTPAEPAMTAREGRSSVEQTNTDPGLAAWRDYVARLQATDPPGGPPRGGPRE